MTGTMVPCCRSSFSYGDWQEAGIQNTWNSKQARLFRSKIVAGEFPTGDCESCYSKGTGANLKKMLGMPLQRLATIVKEHNAFGLGRIGRLRDLFDKKDMDNEATEILADYFQVLDAHLANATDEIYLRAVQKLRVIGNIVRSFLSGDLAPKEAAPVRQINAAAVCNARCIHCPFLYTREIVRGVPMPNGEYKKRMNAGEIREAFAAEDSIIDFFVNGSEFFLVDGWRIVAKKLKTSCVQLRISTNGMLLTEGNVRFLVDNGYISKLNVSLDGAKKETVEKIRKNVSFEMVCRNIHFVYEYTAHTNFPLDISFSFCLMKNNFHELPEFVRLVSGLRGGHSVSNARIMIQPLETRGPRNYLQFVEREHHEAVSREELRATLEETQRQADLHGIPVGIYYIHWLKDYLANGCPEYPSVLVETPEGVGLLDS